MQLFTNEQVSEHVTRIRTPFGVSMFLICGKERALLLDTGMGIGNLKGYVEKLTQLPYDVVLTHGHCDHAGGASQFETVYLSGKDMELEKTHASLEHRIFDVFHAPFGYPEGLSEEDFLPQRNTAYTELAEDMVFELGGVNISFIPLPGHTQGCVVPLIQPDGVMVIGDALGENTLMHFPESTSVETYRRSIERLLAVQDDYRILVRFHGSGCSDKAILQDMYDLCTEIMEGRGAHVPGNMMGIAGCWGREKEHLGKHGNMIYNPDKIFDEGGSV